jgi:hypothetical protein
MANASIKTKDGKRSILYRGYTDGTLSTTLYTPPIYLTVGVDNATPSQTSTDLDFPIPIANGTVNDNGANTLTGSLGGSNSTNNTTTYKEGAGQTDNTAQNLVTTGSNTTKQWTRTGITSNVVTTSRISAWIYIKDATALAKFLSSGTALELRFGSDASNYYALARTAAQLAVGWNLVTTNKSAVSTLTATGTPGTLSRLDILIYTNNAADAFVAGDVVYDLLRQWTEANTLVSYDASYPVIDYTNLEVTRKVTLNSAQANGYSINVVGTKNSDTTKLLTDVHTITVSSKDSTDEQQYFIVDRYR